MRKLTSQEFHDHNIQRVLDDFSGRMAENDIKESDVVSVSVFPEPPRDPQKGGLISGMTSNAAALRIVVVYWSAD
jgi:hypothetical protein